jgi:hypothetical protein
MGDFMRHFERGERAALRRTLLLGAAGAAAVGNAALADQAPTSPPADPQKWSPYSSISGSAGSGMVGGKLDFFVPLFQNSDSLFFATLGVGTETKAHTVYNIGGGYRTQIDGEWIVGAYVSHDGSQLQDNNTFGQTALGAELMSADWDVRLNGYIADNEAKVVPGDFGLFISGTNISILQGQDVGYSGFDGEVGYRVFSDDNMDVRVFIGGFHFSHDNSTIMSMGQSFGFSYRDITGPKARAEVTIYDLDEIGNQSRLSASAEISHDDVRGTTGFVGATLTIPLGNFSGGSGAQALSELDRRMVDPERRNDTVLTRSEMTKPEPVIIYGPGFRSQPTNTLLYVDNTLGQGTYANPTTFADAASRPTTNAFIVLTSKQGPITGGATLQSGQTVVAGGETFTVEGAVSHAKFTHLFDPSTNVTVVPATPGGNVITLASNTNLYGFDIKGDFGSAVYGKNVDHVNISHVNIDGTGGGYNGIYIVHNKSGEEIVNIDHTTIANVGGDGILLASNISDGGTSTETFTISNVAVTNAHYDGVSVSDYADQGSKITSAATLSSITVTGGGTGILVGAGAYGAGSSATQTATISSPTVTGAAYTGIDANVYAGGGASATQTVTLSGATVSNSAGGGIHVSAYAYGAGSVATQNATITGASVTNAYGTAFNIGASARNGGHAVQTATITNSSGTNSYTGLGIFASAVDNNTTTPTTVDQTVSVTGSTFSNDYYGAVIRNTAIPMQFGNSSMSATSQTVNFTNATLNNNYTGLEAETFAAFGAAANQYVNFSGVQIDHNRYAGADMVADGIVQGFARQHVSFDDPNGYNDVSYNGGEGILAESFAAAGGLVDQHLYVYHTNADHNATSGVVIEAVASGYTFKNSQIYYSHIQQNVIVAYGSISHNGANGVTIENTVTYTPQVDQIVQLYGEVVDHNTGNGLYETSTVKTYQGYGFAANTVLHSDVYLQNSDFSYNTASGINIVSTLKSPTYILGAGHYQFSYLEQHISASGVTANHNTSSGFVDTVNDQGVYGINIHYVTLASSQFDNNGANGAQFVAHQVFGPGSFGAAEQIVTLSGSQFNSNTGNGIYASAYAGGNQGRAEQHFTVQGSYFNNNSANGIELKRVAENGVYVSGLPCTTAQGLAGGCAFVRSTFNMTGGGASSNGANGIYISNYANNYGAIYNSSGRPHSPTVLLYGSTFDHNGAYGLKMNNAASNHSYMYQYVAAIDSHFDHNGAGGFLTYSYAGGTSTILQRQLLYSYHTGASASYNGGNGFKTSIEALGGSYVRNVNIVEGVNLSQNGGFGFDGTVSYADASSTGLQINALYFNTVNHNGDGIGLYSIGPGAQQISYVGSNKVQYNAFVGVYGEANFGSFQYVEVYSLGNTVNNNGTNYLFNSFGGSTQILH